MKTRRPTREILFILAMQDRDAGRLDEPHWGIEASPAPALEPPARDDRDDGSGCTSFEL